MLQVKLTHYPLLKRKQILACYYIQNMQLKSLVPSSSEDVFTTIYLLFVHNFHCQVYIKCGTKCRESFVDMKKVAAAVGQDICSALPGVHSFTGCDTVSAFGGKGKVSALKLMQKTWSTNNYLTSRERNGQLQETSSMCFKSSPVSYMLANAHLPL